VWINFNTGFCKGYARVLPSEEPTGKLQIRFQHNNEKIIVDEDDVEKANPEFLDFCEDISQLKYLNETSVLNSLRQRYEKNAWICFGFFVCENVKNAWILQICQ
jgi:myosin XVIII